MNGLSLTKCPYTLCCVRVDVCLQGPGTDAATIQTIRDSIKTGEEITVRILNYKRNGAPFWNMFTLAPMKDSDGTTRFLVGVQVDVTAQGEAADTTAPKWTKTASDEALRVKQGNQAANLISNALQNMGWGASPWAKLQGHVMRTKPHKVMGCFGVLHHFAASVGGVLARQGLCFVQQCVAGSL